MKGKAPEGRGSESPLCPGAASGGARRAGLPESGTKSLEPGKKDWKQRTGGGGGIVVTKFLKVKGTH